MRIPSLTTLVLKFVINEIVETLKKVPNNTTTFNVEYNIWRWDPYSRINGTVSLEALKNAYIIPLERNDILTPIYLVEVLSSSGYKHVVNLEHLCEDFNFLFVLTNFLAIQEENLS